MKRRALALPSASWVRALVDEVVGVEQDAATNLYGSAFDALGLDVIGRLEVGARMAKACEAPVPLDVVADGSSTPSDLIRELITSQLDLASTTHQGG